MRNPKTKIGLAVLGVLLVALGFLIGQMVPTIGRVRWEMSLTPTPVPDAPESVMAVTPDPSQPTPAPDLRHNSVGPEVEELQARLKELGYYQGEIDGRFGDGTREAVMAFQKAAGLTADGIVGEKTREALWPADSE